MKKFSMMMAMLLIVSFCFATWLSVEESVVTLPPGESVTVNLTANGANLAPGNYELPLTVITNDPELEIVEIPATATIFTKPKIASVVDVPNDQGGWVFVEFYRCFYDDTPLNDDRSAEVYTIEMNNGDGWIAVGTLSAYAENSYSALIPTTTDATETNEALFDFRIIAAMDEGNWVSDVVQGFSVDNIVPAPPVNLLSNAMHESVEIKWDIPVEDDYQYSKIYQNDVLVGTTAELSFVDNNVLANSEYIYTVKHVDANGNVGESTVLTTRTLAWSIQLSIEDNNFVLGTANEASVLFDDGFDIPLPPSPPTDFVEIYAHHPEWNFVLGDKFMQDVQGIVELADDMQVWEIHLLSDNDGDVAVNFDFSAEVPALPAFIYDESLSYKVALTDAMTHTFTLVANTEAVFYLAIGDNTAPVNAVTYPNGLEFLQSGEEATVTFDAVDGYLFENSVSISYDGETYEEIGVTADNSITFTPENTLSNSCYLKVVSTDFAGNFVEDISDYEFTVVSGELAVDVATGWSLFSSPILFENTITEQIADDYANTFYAFGWNGGGYDFADNAAVGNGIWLGFTEDVSFTLSGVPYLAAQTATYNAGWNLVSNPLVRDIAKENLLVTHNEIDYSFADAVENGLIIAPLYSYANGVFTDNDVVQHFDAYWLGVLTDEVAITYAPHQAESTRSRVERELAWTIGCDATMAESYASLTVGVADDGTAGFDVGYDHPSPPNPPANFVKIYTSHLDWENPLGDNFSQDIYPEIDLTDDMQVWEVHLLADNNGDATVTFAFSELLPAVPVFIYQEEEVVRSVGQKETTRDLVFKEQIEHNESYVFSLVANEEQTFYLAVGDITPPELAVTYPNGLEFLQSGEEATFTFDVTDGYSVDENVVSISYDGVEYSEVGVATENSITFTPENALSNSCYLKVISTDFAENFSEDVSDYEFTVVGNELANNLNVGWHLWSSALAFENTLAEQIADDYEGAFYPYAWTDGGYLVPENITTGQSIWLGFMEDAEFDIVGVPYLAEQEIAMELGWNLIANPLVREVDKSMLIVVVDEVEYTFADAVTNGFIENSVYGFNVDEYINVDALSYANGYWFGSFVDGVTVRFAPHQTVVARETVEREYLWQVEINNLNIAGMENTNPAWDVNDAPLPPATPLGFVADMYITHPEWNNPLGNNFNSDIRPVADLTDAQTYELVITTPQTLTWTLTDIDAEIEVILTIDDVDYDLKVIDELVVESCNATLVIGDVLDANENEIAVVTRLNGNYPNPFNPTTTISFSLTADNAKNAEIEIFNIKGQKVETHQITNSPNQQIVWNADNHASGVYFYKLIVDGKPVDTRKMILLKQ